MRIVFTTTPGWGHVHPMVPLARAFRDRGDEVLWVLAAEVCPRLMREGFQTRAGGLGGAESHQEFNRRFPEIEELPPQERPDFMFPRLFGTVRAAPMLADLRPIVQDYAPSLLVHDSAEFAGPIAASAAGVPSLCHAFGALTPAQRVADAGKAVEPLWEELGLQPRPYGGSYDHLYIDIYPPGMQAADMAHVPARQSLRPVTFATVGEEALPERFKEGSSPLAYVTFGTVFNADVSLVSTVVGALRDLPLRVVVTVGPDQDPALLGDQPPNVHVARYIPQTEILQHCAVVVSHAGSGTLLASLARGLPQLCLPQAADQFTNAEACVRAGAGIALQPGTVTREAVRNAVDELLSNSQARAAASRLSEEIAQMPDPSEVAAIIANRFAAHH